MRTTSKRAGKLMGAPASTEPSVADSAGAHNQEGGPMSERYEDVPVYEQDVRDVAFLAMTETEPVTEPAEPDPDQTTIEDPAGEPDDDDDEAET